MQGTSGNIQEILCGFPKVDFSITPTPCHRLNRLSKRYGVEMYCKRDDMTGFGFGGNKARKLEFLIGDAIHRGCDTVVTCGGIQSNFCRLTSAIGAAYGLSVHLVLGGGMPDTPRGNLLLDEMLGARIHFVRSDDWNEWEREADNITEKLRSKGTKVFRMPIGGSVPLGVAGYMMVFDEIMRDQERLGIVFDHIIHASSSGGTQVGLILGKFISGWMGEITGVSVAIPSHELKKIIKRLIQETSELLKLNSTPPDETIQIEDRFIGDGYAIFTDGAKNAIDIFSRYEGIFLDRVYTGKAGDALISWLENGRLKGKNILFLHTGGQVELFS